MMLLRVLAAMFMFVGILAGCLALLLLVILLVRFPPLLIAVLLACWILCQLLKVFRTSEATPTKPPPPCSDHST
ncbi:MULTISPECIES: hypothetical protein [Pseudomonas]|uniref:hypothetical protein n=1 Tax=Pseudomonas TaxID=286 RepID=UPI000773F5E9|nr:MULTISPECIES: hypothetical protein [Pseudomonas]KXK69723.1 hypothetical protein BC89_17775 [Pseudomonas monteilii]WPU59465.1 hypothetical protein SQW15_22585 [Pseudomonas asiatica]